MAKTKTKTKTGKKTWKKVFTAVLLVLALVLLLPVLLLESKTFQTRLASSVLDKVSDNLPVHFHIDSLAITPSRMCVEVYGLSATDSLASPILYVRRIDGSIRLLSFLLHNEIAVNNIHVTGLDLRLAKDSLDSPLNISYLFSDKKEDDVHKEPKPLNLNLRSLMILDGHVSYDVLSEPYIETTDPNHLSVNINTQLAMKLSIIPVKDTAAVPSEDGRNGLHADVRLNKFSLKEKNGLIIDRIRLHASIDNDSVCFRGMELDMPGSFLKINSFSLNGPLEQGVLQNTATIKAEFSPADFPTVSKAYHHAGLVQDKLKILASVNGNIDRINASVGISLGNLLTIDGWCKATDILTEDRKISSSWKKTGVDSRLTGLIEEFVPSFTSPAIIDAIGFARYNGEASLSGGVPELRGTLSTALGDILLDASIHNVDSLHQLTAAISTTDFAADKLGLDFLTGPASLSAKAEGFLPQKDSPLKAEASVNIDHVSLLSYDYENLAINASAGGKLYQACFQASDTNCCCLLKATYDQREYKPQATVSLDVHHVNLHEIGILESNDGKSDLSFSMNGYVSGSTAQEIVSSVKLEISDFSLSGNGAVYNMDRLTVVSGKHQNNTYLQLTSPLLTGRIVGTGTCLDMIGQVRDGIVNRYLPSLYIGNNWKPSDDLYQLAFHLKGTQQLFKAIGLPATIEGIADLDGSYNNETGAINLSLVSSDVSLGGKRILLPSLSIDNRDSSHVSIHAKSGLMKNGDRSDVELSMSVMKDSVDLSALWNQFAVSEKGILNMSVGIHHPTHDGPLEVFSTFASPSAFLGEDEWVIEPSEIHIIPDRFELRHVSLHSEDKFLIADGVISKDDTDTLVFDLKGICLDDIFDMLPSKEKDPFTLGGITTAKGRAVSLLSAPRIEAMLAVDGFAIKKRLLGDLEAVSWWDEQDMCIRLDGAFSKDTASIAKVSGKFTPAISNMSLDVSTNGLPIDFVGSFLEPALTIKGPVYGNVGVNIGFHEITEIGLEGVPVFKGEVGIPPIGARFQLDDVIELHPGQIRFNKVKLKDYSGHTGTLDGDLKHSNFKDIHFNMGVDMQSLRVMDLPHSTTETMYGNVLASGNVSITGTDKDIRINVNAKTDNPSSFTFALDGTSVSDYDFVHIVDHTLVSSSEKEEVPSVPLKNRNSSLNIGLQLEVTDDTEINLLLNRTSGDGIYGWGNGKIRIDFATSGDFGIFGDYELHRGMFKFNFKNLIQRNFTIESGSRIRFTGDPLKAQMGVMASYRVNGASLRGILSESELELLNMTRTTIPVDCKLALSGELQQPEIYMDLAFPNADSEVERRIRSVINTDEVLSRQVVYLLVLNSFAPTDNSAIGNTATSNMNAVWGATLSGLSTQLSQVLTDALGTDKFSLGFNYNSDLNTGTNEWQVAMTGNLLDNRLKIMGNLGQRDNLVTNSSEQFIGDFDLEYKLSQRLRLKAYSHSNDSRYFKSAATTQGLGIVIKDSFNSISQLWNNWAESFRRQKIRSFSYSDLLPKASTPEP